MTRNERERLIQRYMSGEMPLAEEHDFFIQVALDRQLWLDLKAHQTIESAMMKDRVVEPSEIAMMGAQVTAMLAATHAPAGSGSSALQAASSPAATAQGAVAMIGGGAMKWLAASLCMTGLVAVSAVIAPLLPPQALPPPPPAAIATPHMAPIPIPPAETEGAQTVPDASPRPDASSPLPSREEARGAQGRRGGPDEITRAAEASPRVRERKPSRQIPAARSAGDSIPLGARIRLSKPSGK